MVGVEGILGPDDLAEWRKVWSINEALGYATSVSLAEATAEMERLVALISRFYEVYELDKSKYYTFNVYTGVIKAQG